MMIGGRYRPVERIASGGMGDVWQAHDTLLERTVAVKILKPEYAGNAEFRLRLRREARHVAGLNHPGIARMYDHGEEPEPYLVMEFVEGEPLSAVLTREGALSARRTASFVAQTADALACAHGRGIVHRDVKPDNLLVTEDDVVKVTDFGIALAADGVAITQTGTFMGTPRYASPEQVMGRSATASSDLYALGLVAYECLTGAAPYEGGPVALALAHRDKPLPALPERVPEPMRRLISALTAKDPAQRPADAATVADWARQLAADPEAAVVPEPPDSGPRTAPMAMPVSSGREPERASQSRDAAAGAASDGVGRAGTGGDVSGGSGAATRKRLMVGSAIVAAVLLAGGLGWMLRPSAPSVPATAHSPSPKGTRPTSIRVVTMPPAVRTSSGPRVNPANAATPRHSSTTSASTSTAPVPPAPAPKKNPGKAKGHHKGPGGGPGKAHKP